VSDLQFEQLPVVPALISGSVGLKFHIYIIHAREAGTRN
jgi:hypothetical protein